MEEIKVIIGADHGGFELKEKLKKWMVENDIHGEDVGAAELVSDDDFVDYADAVASRLRVMGGMGVLICRNGVGMDMVANRYGGVRCCLGFDKEQVKRARSDDDVNCLAIPADYLEFDQVAEIVKTFLETEFSGKDRYKRRLSKLEFVGHSDHDHECACGGACGNC